MKIIDKSEEIKETFKLKSMHMHYIDYGDLKGQYSCHLEFIGTKGNEFKFKLNPEDNQKVLDLIKEKVIITASEIGERLAEALK